MLLLRSIVLVSSKGWNFRSAPLESTESHGSEIGSTWKGSGEQQAYQQWPTALTPPQKLPSVPLQIWDARLSTFPFVDTHFHVENSLSPECPTTRNLKTSSPFRSRMLRALEIVPVSPLALEVATEKNLTFQMVRGCSFSF